MVFRIFKKEELEKLSLISGEWEGSYNPKTKKWSTNGKHTKTADETTRKTITAIPSIDGSLVSVGFADDATADKYVNQLRK